MKGIICYYSGSGNTKLACEYIKGKTNNADFELYNIVKNEIPDFTKYDIVGFAAFADFGAVSKIMYSFVDKMPDQNEKNAFIFNTYGAFSLKTLTTFDELVTGAGFKVQTGYSLHTPESYPPMRKRGMAFDKSPKPKDMLEFDSFISDLDSILNDIKSGKEIKKRKLKLKFTAMLMPGFDRAQAKKDFGIQNVNKELCTECGVCFNGCPYEAITMNPKPVFNHDICAGCWYCYNHCKQKAIYTPKFSGKYQYPKPNEMVMEKLKA